MCSPSRQYVIVGTMYIYVNPRYMFFRHAKHIGLNSVYDFKITIKPVHLLIYK